MSCVHSNQEFLRSNPPALRSTLRCNGDAAFELGMSRKNSSGCVTTPVRDSSYCNEIVQGLEGPDEVENSDSSGDEALPLTRYTSDGAEANPLEHSLAPPSPMIERPRESEDSGVRKMREWLESEGFSEARDFFSDQYLLNAMSALKNGKQRTFEYASKKLADSLNWRRQYGAASITRSDVARALGPNHMWWDGTDIHGRPILYVRPALMDLKTYDRAEYLKAHVFLIEEGLRMMPEDVETFVLITDASNLNRRHFDPSLMKGLLDVLSTGYPDRLGTIIVGPMNFVVRAAWAMLSSLMPKNLAKKIVMAKSLRPLATELLGKEPPEWVP